MKRLALGAMAPMLVAAVMLAGCGSSSSSSSSSGSGGQNSAASQGSTSTAAAYASPAKAVMITTKHAKLGTVLAAGSKHLTVYLFEADKGAKSACTGACAQAWPPVLGKPTASDQARSADLGTTTRPDGKTQVTYRGHPLYFFVKDKDDEDTYGQGIEQFGAEWYVLAPSGNKIDEDKSKSDGDNS
jgi:predicted lipoprotein with Yx(FWY)xxD motif